jgi:hypothetical protein
MLISTIQQPWSRSSGWEVDRIWRGHDDVEVAPVGVHDAELVDLGLDVEAADQELAAVGRPHRLEQLEPVSERRITRRPLPSGCTAVTAAFGASGAMLKVIQRPSGDQSEKKLGTWVSRRWWVPSGLAAQMLKSPSSGSNRPKLIRPLTDRSPAAAGMAPPSMASAMATAISNSLERFSASLLPAYHLDMSPSPPLAVVRNPPRQRATAPYRPC